MEEAEDPICEEWKRIAGRNNCLICRENGVLKCNFSIPSAEDLPTRNLSLFVISQINSLPNDSFSGLSIKKLMIKNSNLSNLAANAFRGVASIKYLHLKYNFIGLLGEADSLFQGIQDLKVMELKRNELRVLSSMSSENLSNLEYFSLTGNGQFYNHSLVLMILNKFLIQTWFYGKFCGKILAFFATLS